MNKNRMIGIVVVVVLAGAVFAFSKQDNSRVATNTGVYCSPDGTLSSVVPIQSHRSYCLKVSSDTGNFQPNTPATFSYSIVDDQGNILKDFDTVHEKIMHFIVVRKDLANFQHVHPEFNATTGEFTLSNLTFPSDGEYRLFADFTPTASQMGPDGMKLPVTLSHDVSVGNLANYKPQPIGAPTNTKAVDGYQVALSTDAPPSTGIESMLMFDIEQNGKSINDSQPYLGALGHAVILREGDLQFIHGHPVESAMDRQTGVVHFMVGFPESGKYKVFLQFQRDGNVSTADFVVDVAQGAPSETGGMEGMQQ